ncbi:MAG: hypothetical protein AAFW89_08865 [Bacteroidota bacterium]
MSQSEAVEFSGGHPAWEVSLTNLANRNVGSGLPLSGSYLMIGVSRKGMEEEVSISQLQESFAELSFPLVLGSGHSVDSNVFVFRGLDHFPESWRFYLREGDEGELQRIMNYQAVYMPTFSVPVTNPNLALFQKTSPHKEVQLVIVNQGEPDS